MRLKDRIYIMYNKVLQTLAFRSQSGHIPQKPRDSGMQSSTNKISIERESRHTQPKAYEKDIKNTFLLKYTL